MSSYPTSLANGEINMPNVCLVNKVEVIKSWPVNNESYIYNKNDLVSNTMTI